MDSATPQQIWNKEGSQKRAAVQSMFAEIAPTYDLLNSLMSLAGHHRWRTRAASKLQLKAGDKVADICCGTGDFAPPLRKLVGDQGVVAGADFCLPMLQKAAEKHMPESLALGDACNLPFQSETFDGFAVGWGIRNVPDIDAAHREAARVLKPGGRFVSLDMAQPRNPVTRSFSRFMSLTMLPLLGKIFVRNQAYKYLPESTKKFKSREELRDSMQSAGFKDVQFEDLMGGNICMHWGVKA